jgi:hypothetical protein
VKWDENRLRLDFDGGMRLFEKGSANRLVCKRFVRACMVKYKFRKVIVFERSLGI